MRFSAKRGLTFVGVVFSVYVLGHLFLNPGLHRLFPNWAVDQPLQQTLIIGGLTAVFSGVIIGFMRERA